jgi:integrase/recombinase XerC
MDLEYLAEFLLHLTDRDCSEGTITTYGGILRRMDTQTECGLDAPPPTRSATGSTWGAADSKATRSLYRTAVASFFAWATDPADPRLELQPDRSVPTVRVPRSGHIRPARACWPTFSPGRAGPYRDWYILASYGGLRCCEIAELDREDITEKSMELHGKGDKYRVVPTHPLVWAAVRDLPPGPVVRNRDGGRTTRLHISRRGNRYLQRTLGYTGLHMHLFRHRFASQIYQSSGYDLRLTCRSCSATPTCRPPRDTWRWRHRPGPARSSICAARLEPQIGRGRRSRLRTGWVSSSAGGSLRRRWRIS